MIWCVAPWRCNCYGAPKQSIASIRFCIAAGRRLHAGAASLATARAVPGRPRALPEAVGGRTVVICCRQPVRSSLSAQSPRGWIDRAQRENRERLYRQHTSPEMWHAVVARERCGGAASERWLPARAAIDARRGALQQARRAAGGLPESLEPRPKEDGDAGQLPR